MCRGGKLLNRLPLFSWLLSEANQTSHLHILPAFGWWPVLIACSAGALGTVRVTWSERTMVTHHLQSQSSPTTELPWWPLDKNKKNTKREGIANKWSDNSLQHTTRWFTTYLGLWLFTGLRAPGLGNTALPFYPLSWNMIHDDHGPLGAQSLEINTADKLGVCQRVLGWHLPTAAHFECHLPLRWQSTSHSRLMLNSNGVTTYKTRGKLRD